MGIQFHIGGGAIGMMQHQRLRPEAHGHEQQRKKQALSFAIHKTEIFI